MLLSLFASDLVDDSVVSTTIIDLVTSLIACFFFMFAKEILKFVPNI